MEREIENMIVYVYVLVCAHKRNREYDCIRVCSCSCTHVVHLNINENEELESMEALHLIPTLLPRLCRASGGVCSSWCQRFQEAGTLRLTPRQHLHHHHPAQHYLHQPVAAHRPPPQPANVPQCPGVLPAAAPLLCRSGAVPRP